MTNFVSLFYPSAYPSGSWARSSLLFYDKIRTIVPRDVSISPPWGIKELMDTIPGAIETISPIKSDVQIDTINLDRLKKAFTEIKGKKTREKMSRIKIKIHKTGAIEIEGYAFLHNTKISNEVRNLLEEFGLVRPDLQCFANNLASDSFSIVNQDASRLILSLIADKLARKNGWNTITEHEIDFTINALNALDISTIGEPDSVLANSLICCEIPIEVEKMKMEKYVKLRQAYSEIRVLFHRAVDEICSLNRLQKIENPKNLQDRIAEITEDFHKGVINFRKMRFAKQFKRWMPISIGSLVSFLNLAWGRKDIAIVCEGLSIVIQLIQDFTKSDQPESNADQLKRQLARVRGDILRSAEVRRLI
ncbi:MAG TPA: hypothetical protein VMX17_16260 [Candidatus Glassbacteria bacterium]|nr:hypothetical protein [Candidatus Glassbacteria bacterium]